MKIKTFVETSYQGMYKLSPEEGAAFFVRKEYVPENIFDRIDNGEEFTEEETGFLLDSGLACAVELKAVSYLSRAEQSRFGLSRKLLEKGFDKKYIQMALDLLEKKNYLSDYRFSRAWLNSRKINHNEGRVKLLSELLSRGISKENSEKALNEFFEENDEMEMCSKAYQKFLRKTDDKQKLVQLLLNAGFSYKIIKQILCE